MSNSTKQEIKAIELYLDDHGDELLDAIKTAQVESVRSPNIGVYVAIYADEDGIKITTLPEYADDVKMTRTDGKDPYLAYSAKTDNATAEWICNVDDSRIAETDEEILAELDLVVNWRDEVLKVYDALDSIEQPAKRRETPER